MTAAEKRAARAFQEAAQGNGHVEEFLKVIASKLAAEAELWARVGGPGYQQAFVERCHHRVGFILSDELGMARIQSMRVNPDYASWITLEVPYKSGTVAADIQLGVNPVWWAISGWKWNFHGDGR
jgi:hypothetical protein